MDDICYKQYLITRNKVVGTTMKEYVLSCGAYLYVDRHLHIRFLEDLKHRQYIVLGNIFCSDKIGNTIEESVKSFKGDSLNDLCFNWTGKWLVICENEIQIDGGGLMPAFYSITDNNWYISSSLAMLKNLEEINSSKKVAQEGLTWQLLPETILEGVKSLICTQKILMSYSTISVVFNLWIKKYENLTSDEKIALVIRLLTTSIKNIYSLSEKSIWIALTAGKDSRLVLAAALASHIEFSAYTFEHSNISSSDKKIPEILAKRFAFPYKYIYRKKLKVQKKDFFELFTAGNSQGADRLFYAHGQFEELPSDAILIRSGLFEIGQKCFRTITGTCLDDFVLGLKNYYKDSFKDVNQKKAFEEWLEYVKLYPIDFIDIRDRMYLEQRVGGWVSAIEHSLDLNNCESIQIANNRALLSVLLSATPYEREHLTLSFETIKILLPELSSFPYNQTSWIDKIHLIYSVLLSPLRTKRLIHRFYLILKSYIKMLKL